MYICEKHCPLEYRNNIIKLGCLGGWYTCYSLSRFRYKNDKTYENMKDVVRYATFIRDLKPRDGVKFK